MDYRAFVTRWYIFTVKSEEPGFLMRTLSGMHFGSSPEIWPIPTPEQLRKLLLEAGFSGLKVLEEFERGWIYAVGRNRC